MTGLNNIYAYFNVTPSNANPFALNPRYFKDDIRIFKGLTASLRYCRCNYLNKIPLKYCISKATLLVWTV